MDSSHKGPVMRKVFPWHDVVMASGDGVELVQLMYGAWCGLSWCSCSLKILDFFSQSWSCVRPEYWCIYHWQLSTHWTLVIRYIRDRHQCCFNQWLVACSAAGSDWTTSQWLNQYCHSGKIWYLQHNCVGDTIVYHDDSNILSAPIHRLEILKFKSKDRYLPWGKCFENIFCEELPYSSWPSYLWYHIHSERNGLQCGSFSKKFRDECLKIIDKTYRKTHSHRNLFLLYNNTCEIADALFCIVSVGTEYPRIRYRKGIGFYWRLSLLLKCAEMCIS